MLYYKLNDGSFFTRWQIEFDSELTPKQMKAVIDLVKKYNSANPKWKAWTNKSLTEETIYNWNDSFRGVNVLTNNNRNFIFEFHCNSDDTRWWREWLVLKFFPDLKAKIGPFKEPRILQLDELEPKRKLGTAKIKISGYFDESLEDFKEYMQ